MGNSKSKKIKVYPLTPTISPSPSATSVNTAVCIGLSFSYSDFFTKKNKSIEIYRDVVLCNTFSGLLDGLKYVETAFYTKIDTLFLSKGMDSGLLRLSKNGRNTYNMHFISKENAKEVLESAESSNSSQNSINPIKRKILVRQKSSQLGQLGEHERKLSLYSSIDSIEFCK